MPIIAYKEKFNHGADKEHICLAFNCVYTDTGFLKLKDYQPDYFSGIDVRIKIKKAINKFTPNIQKEYLDKNQGVYCLGVLDYFVDEIPSIYSIRFESDSSESIYYADELKNINK